MTTMLMHLHFKKGMKGRVGPHCLAVLLASCCGCPVRSQSRRVSWRQDAGLLGDCLQEWQDDARMRHVVVRFHYFSERNFPQ